MAAEEEVPEKAADVTGPGFVIVVRFDLRDDAAARAFDALTAEALPHIRDTEPGTLVYAVHRVEDEPLSRVFYEVYADREAHRRHEANPPTARFLAAIQEHLSQVRAEFLSDPTGKGVGPGSSAEDAEPSAQDGEPSAQDGEPSSGSADG